MKIRKESDSFGETSIPIDMLYGPQTARSLMFFSSSGLEENTMPKDIIFILTLIKKCAAKSNKDLGLLSSEIADLIVYASNKILSEDLSKHFPLKVWQTGSGTQTNMNVNEVISNIASNYSKKFLGYRIKIHPNDHVNMSQSSNDVFPTAMHIAAVMSIKNKLIPSLNYLKEVLIEKSKEFIHIRKIGRTHLMDALPISLGQEFSGYVDQIEKNIERIGFCLSHLYELAIGATAVGSSLNCPKGFVEKIISYLNQETKENFFPASNYFSALSCHDSLVFMHSAFKTLACSLFKIATDLSFLCSGPRCGLNEIFFPENEQGSSIMPGKINPTQCEMLLMVCCQILGNDEAITLGGSRGNFELNIFKPMIIYNFLNTVYVLSGSLQSFAKFFVSGLRPNIAQLTHNLNESLMLVTALSPKIGYEKASKIALKAYHENLSLKEACLALGFLEEQEFDILIEKAKETLY